VLLGHGSATERLDAASVHQRIGGRQALVVDTESGDHGGAGISPVVGVAGLPCDESGIVEENMRYRHCNNYVVLISVNTHFQ